MADMRDYKVRYSVELWNKPVPSTAVLCQAIPGVKVAEGDYGYADQVFVASIICGDDGEPLSVLLIDSESGGRPSRKMLELIRAQIDHHLKHHVT